MTSLNFLLDCVGPICRLLSRGQLCRSQAGVALQDALEEQRKGLTSLNARLENTKQELKELFCILIARVSISASPNRGIWHVFGCANGSS